MDSVERFSSTTRFRLRYLDTGTERSDTAVPPVVLLHDGAWGADAEGTWSRMLPHMTTEARCIAPDLPGFGRSDKVVFLDRSPYEFRALAVFELLDELGIAGPVDLVGSSFGGSVALRALQVDAIAGRIRSVTSISGTGGPFRTPTGISELGHFDGTAEDMERIVGHLAGPFDGYQDYLARRVQMALLPGHYQSMVAPHAKVPGAGPARRAEDPYPEVLRRSAVPLHLIAGDRDVLVEQGWAEQLADLSGGATRVTHMDAAHSPNLSHPAETWTAIDSFLGTLS